MVDLEMTHLQHLVKWMLLVAAMMLLAAAGVGYSHA